MKTIDSTFESTLYPRLIHKTFIKNFKFMTYARVNRGGGVFLSILRENGQRVILKNYF